MALSQDELRDKVQQRQAQGQTFAASTNQFVGVPPPPTPSAPLGGGAGQQADKQKQKQAQKKKAASNQGYIPATSQAPGATQTQSGPPSTTGMPVPHGTSPGLNLGAMFGGGGGGFLGGMTPAERERIQRLRDARGGLFGTGFANIGNAADAWRSAASNTWDAFAGSVIPATTAYAGGLLGALNPYPNLGPNNLPPVQSLLPPSLPVTPIYAAGASSMGGAPAGGGGYNPVTDYPNFMFGGVGTGYQSGDQRFREGALGSQFAGAGGNVVPSRPPLSGDALPRFSIDLTGTMPNLINPIGIPVDQSVLGGEGGGFDQVFQVAEDTFYAIGADGSEWFALPDPQTGEMTTVQVGEATTGGTSTGGFAGGGGDAGGGFSGGGGGGGGGGGSSSPGLTFDGTPVDVAQTQATSLIGLMSQLVREPGGDNILDLPSRAQEFIANLPPAARERVFEILRQLGFQPTGTIGQYGFDIAWLFPETLDFSSPDLFAFIVNGMTQDDRLYLSNLFNRVFGLGTPELFGIEQGGTSPQQFVTPNELPEGTVLPAPFVPPVPTLTGA